MLITSSAITIVCSSKYVFMNVCRVTMRSVSTIEITKNISLISNNVAKGVAFNDLSLQSKQCKTTEKPLVVLLNWLMARRSHVMKYANLYMDRGFDVLNVSITPWQLLWPMKGTQVVASEIIQFLEEHNKYSPLFLHGFSVGGYLWAEVLVKMIAQPERYNPILSRIVGQVWDSLADITEIPEGLPIAVFPKNTVLQYALRRYILYHMKTFDKVATSHYVRASQLFHTNPIKAPALFFISKIDTIGALKSNMRCRQNWEDMGIQTYWKCWNDSYHVGHYRKHPKEYTEELNKFITLALYKDSATEKSPLRAKL